MKLVLKILVICSIFFSSIITVDLLTTKVKAEEPIIIEDVDWSNNGFSDVKITVHQSDSNSTRSKETSPSIEIDFIIDETNEEVHFERIGSLGYHYVDDKLTTIIEYPNFLGG